MVSALIFTETVVRSQGILGSLGYSALYPAYDKSKKLKGSLGREQGRII